MDKTMDKTIVIRDRLYNAEEEVRELKRLLVIAYRRLRYEQAMNGHISWKNKVLDWIWGWFI